MLRRGAFDTQAQAAALVIVIAVLTPIVMLLTGKEGATIGIGFLIAAVLVVIGVAWFVIRLRRMRRMFAGGVEVDATVVELRPGALSARDRLRVSRRGAVAARATTCRTSCCPRCGRVPAWP